MDMFTKIKWFIDDIRRCGLPVGVSQEEDCFRALLLIDWEREVCFHTALSATLLKDSAYLELFDRIYGRHFYPWIGVNAKEATVTASDSMLASLALSVNANQAGKSTTGEIAREDKKSKAIAREVAIPRQKNPMTRDFYEAACSGNADELWQMEQMVPLLAKRLASRMILKQKYGRNGSIDFRRTMRKSMGQGGVPIDLAIRKKQRDNPVIFALCDVSWSCLQFSYFSLAIVYALEKFFRQVRSFAFIGITDEITDLVKQEAYQNLRSQTLSQANVIGKSGYTDYGGALNSFFQRYGRELTSRSQVLIFGDARTNWFGTRTEVLREIRNRVKRVYWFNPEPQSDWGTGDSSMLAYQKYCHQVFACANLEQLAQAICEID